MGTGIKCEYSLSEAIGQLIIWLILTIITLGLALFVLPYYFLKGPLNKCFVVDQDGRKLARLQVDVSLAEIIGHAVIWLLLSVITLGLAYLVYWPSVMKRLLNGVTYYPVSGGSAVDVRQTGPVMST